MCIGTERDTRPYIPRLDMRGSTSIFSFFLLRDFEIEEDKLFI